MSTVTNRARELDAGGGVDDETSQQFAGWAGCRSTAEATLDSTHERPYCSMVSPSNWPFLVMYAVVIDRGAHLYAFDRDDELDPAKDPCPETACCSGELLTP